MSQPHKFHLSLGSNIQPEANLAAAIDGLRAHGKIDETSSVWQSHAVGSGGPDFLNVCLSLVVPLEEKDLKSRILLPIEAALGRVRGPDKNAPRTIDIDIVMMDGKPLNLERWTHAFVVMPMAELLPQLIHPVARKQLSEVARETQSATWIVRRPEGLWKSSEQHGG